MIIGAVKNANHSLMSTEEKLLLHRLEESAVHIAKNIDANYLKLIVERG